MLALKRATRTLVKIHSKTYGHALEALVWLVDVGVRVDLAGRVGAVDGQQVRGRLQITAENVKPY